MNKHNINQDLVHQNIVLITEDYKLYLLYYVLNKLAYQWAPAKFAGKLKKLNN